MSVAEQINAIACEDLGQLRARWERLYGAPPRLRSVGLLRQILAWRLQADQYGGLDTTTRRLLRQTLNGPETSLASGTVLTREWRGTRHRVEVVDKGFIYAGRHWTSLSQIARDITGTRWNGPRFFGQREAL